MQSTLELFLSMMSAEKGSSQNTLNAYRSDLEQFLSFKNTAPENITATSVSDFIQNLSSKGFAVKTLNRKLSAIRDFCKFLVEEKILSENPLPDITSPKSEKSLPKFMTPDQVQTLYEKALSHNNKTFKRAGAVIELMFSSGLRVSEAVSLPLSAINHNKKQITVKGKGSKERIVFIDEKTNRVLFDYINNIRQTFLKNKKPSLFLFPSKTAADGHLTRDSFFKTLKLLAIECGISPSLISPHVLRHSFATNLINHDVDLRSVQKMLGHENISTTEIYTHVSAQKIIDSVLEKHPLKDFEIREVKK